MWSSREAQVPWLQAARVRILALLLAMCFIQGKTLNLSGPHFPICKVGLIVVPSSLARVLTRHSEPRRCLLLSVLFHGPRDGYKDESRRSHFCSGAL